MGANLDLTMSDGLQMRRIVQASNMKAATNHACFQTDRFICEDPLVLSINRKLGYSKFMPHADQWVFHVDGAGHFVRDQYDFNVILWSKRFGQLVGEPGEKVQQYR